MRGRFLVNPQDGSLGLRCGPAFAAPPPTWHSGAREGCSEPRSVPVLKPHWSAKTTWGLDSHLALRRCTPACLLIRWHGNVLWPGCSVGRGTRASRAVAGATPLAEGSLRHSDECVFTPSPVMPGVAPEPNIPAGRQFSAARGSGPFACQPSGPAGWLASQANPRPRWAPRSLSSPDRAPSEERPLDGLARRAARGPDRAGDGTLRADGRRSDPGRRIGSWRKYQCNNRPNSVPSCRASWRCVDSTSGGGNIAASAGSTRPVTAASSIQCSRSGSRRFLRWCA